MGGKLHSGEPTSWLSQCLKFVTSTMIICISFLLWLNYQTIQELIIFFAIIIWARVTTNTFMCVAWNIARVRNCPDITLWFGHGQGRRHRPLFSNSKVVFSMNLMMNRAGSKLLQNYNTIRWLCLCRTEWLQKPKTSNDPVKGWPATMTGIQQLSD